MTPKSLVRQYLPKINVMQLATLSDNKPWICTVHYFNDDQLNLYWLSLADRRHSKEIFDNNIVASYILVHENTPDEDYVIGISFEGRADQLVPGDIDKSILDGYMNKFGERLGLAKEILDGKSPHKLYKFSTSKITLFDNKNFPKDPKKEIKLN